MLIKIHFDEKTVLLAPENDPELAAATDQKELLWINDAQPSDVARVAKEIGSWPQEGVVLTGNPEALLGAFKKELHLVQAAGGLVHAGRGEVLLIFRRGKWDLPKGKLDEGEDLETCALREIREETGLVHLKAEAPLYTTYHTYHHKGRHVLKESFWYRVAGTKGDPLIPQTDEDIEQCLWVRIEELAPYLENAHTSLLDVMATGLKALKDEKNV